MRIVSISADTQPLNAGASLAVGNFDGVHIGHQAVVQAARAAGAALGAPVAAAVFSPHPKSFFQPGAAPFRLQSDAQRAKALAACGVETVYVIQFDESLAKLTDVSFIQQVLLQAIGVQHVSVGFDYHYGRGRMADASTLTVHGAAFGFGVSVVDAVLQDGEKVSSSGVRTALSVGDLARAGAWMTRPFAIEGVVAQGFQRGRTIGVPTANVALNDYTRPRFGVYAARVNVGDGVWRPAVANCGVKPTIAGEHAPLLETHIFEFDQDIYDRILETQLLSFIRDERKFESFDALRAQIALDMEAARAALA
ncbi:MAG: riboflavin biosynthesis protein RibF [Alphaproteobacteria bacterium]|nr:riboflavin biosynthesis protein RibF [Alphaproteobacteria bacterium]